MSIISFVLGLLSTFGVPGGFSIFFLGFLGPFLLGALAIIAGLFAHDSAHRKGLRADGLATAGIVLGIFGSLAGVMLLLAWRI